MKDTWDPDQYARFQAQRRQPIDDLIGLVERRAGMRVVDLGCGTGIETRRLHEALGATETVGVDDSREMLARSDEHVKEGLRFERAAIEDFVGGRPYDLVFSNLGGRSVASSYARRRMRNPCFSLLSARSFWSPRQADCQSVPTCHFRNTFHLNR